MGKILFVGKNNSDKALQVHNLLSKHFDCEFASFNSNLVLEKTATGEFELVSVYLHDISSEEKSALAFILTHESKVPFILIGTREELHPYFETSKAKILRYLACPIRLSDLINTLKEYTEGETEVASIQQASAITHEKRSVLVVDDDAVLLRTVMNWLSEDCDVSVVKSGVQALTFLGKKIPDLILLDYEMPVMNGVQTLEAIRSEEVYKNIPVIFLTGVNDAGLVKNALALQPQGYILKSAGKNPLISKIQEVLVDF